MDLIKEMGDLDDVEEVHLDMRLGDGEVLLWPEGQVVVHDPHHLNRLNHHPYHLWVHQPQLVSAEKHFEQ